MKIRDRIRELRRVPAKSLTANPLNWRRHPENQTAAMQAVLSEVGWAGALVAYEHGDELRLIDGHLRAEITPDEEVPVLVLDVTEDEAKKLLATFDPVGAGAEADKAALAALLSEIEIEADEITALLDDLDLTETEPADIVEDEVPEPPADPVTQPGDLWLLGDHRLLCGDSTNADDVARLMDGDKINVAVTSPPYASQRKYDEGSGFTPIHPDKYVEWFDGVQKQVAEHFAVDGSWFVNIKEHCEEGQRVLYVRDLTLAHVRRWGWNFVDEFIWTHGGTPKAVNQRFKNGWEPIFQFTRGRHKFRPDHVRHQTDDVPDWKGLSPNMESVQKHGCTKGMKRKGVDASAKQKGSNAKLQGTSAGGKAISDAVDAATDGMAYPSNALSLGRNREALGHPAAYPVSLPEFFVRAYTDNADIVFDPFLGSGTTLIAAEQLNRKCYGMEISPAYCDVIVNRWENLTGSKAERCPAS